MHAGSRLRCAACGAEPAAREPYPARCAAAGRGDGADHVLARVLDPGGVRFAFEDESQPFVRHRELLHSTTRALAAGIALPDWLRVVRSLDEAVARVDGGGFRVTPFRRSHALSDALSFAFAGGVWVKDETANVSGSHKARHLFGLALHLEAAERGGLTSRAASDRRGLAIASCGNAALAAAVVASASGRPLSAFIPPDADPRVVRRLSALGTRLVVCARRNGEPGDPCMLRFREELAHGAIPFCVQGSENGLCIEGGETLAWEIASDLAAEGVTLDRLFVQVGGGALASACAQGLAEAAALGVIARPPRLHAVQTRAGSPLRRAYERVRARALARLAGAEVPAIGDAARRLAEDPARDGALAARLTEADAAPAVAEALLHAMRHRAEYMWPLEQAAHSVAHGILDDETYDWHAVVSAMLRTGGWPVTADEERLRDAARRGREATSIRVDPTGSAGLAGLLELHQAGVVGAAERVAVLFTGAERA